MKHNNRNKRGTDDNSSLFKIHLLVVSIEDERLSINVKSIIDFTTTEMAIKRFYEPCTFALKGQN